MVILGVNLPSTYFNKPLYDGGVCVVVDGQIIMAIAEERVTRKKRAGGFENSLAYSLARLNLSENDIDLIVYSTCCETIRNSHLINGLERVRTAACNHHLSHALSVYLTSPFEEAIILVMDAGGQVLEEKVAGEWWRSDREQHSYFLARGDKIELIGRDFVKPGSAGIGEVYRAFTYFLGWESSRHANKTMAIAAYGDWDRFKDKEIYYFNNSGQMFSNMRNTPPKSIPMVRELLLKSDIPDILPREPQGEILQDHYDLAAWLQSKTEKAICQKVNYLIEKTGITNVCLSGGVAYNCSAIGKMHLYTRARNFYVHPASGDNGQCLGNAIYGHILNHGNWERGKVFSPYLGGDEEITLSKLERLTGNFRNGFIIKKPSDLTGVVAKLIEDGEIVAWFQGKSEYGPRALGNRSILADPRILSNKQRMNRLKGRENFMPFAASVLADHMNDCFQCVESPYMTAAFKVNSVSKNSILAVLHHDDTSRIQTVRREFNPLFYELIYRFFLRTNVPLVLNTSFNGPGEPIVESLEDAMETFGRLDIKFLAAGPFLIEKVIEDIGGNLLMNISAPFFQVDLSKSEVVDGKKLRKLLKSKFPKIKLIPREKFLLYEGFIEWLKRDYKFTTIRYKKGGIDFPIRKMMHLFPTQDFSSISSGREVGKVKLTKYSVKKFGELDDFDAKRDGFDSTKKLKEVLSHIYGKIQEEEYISIYNIEII
jgi:carbamoyltransferase